MEFRPLATFLAEPVSYGIVQPGAHQLGGVPILRAGDIQDGSLRVNDPLRVSRRIHDSFRRTRLAGGELVISVVGNPGRTAVVPPALAGWNVARAIAVMRVAKSTNPHWLHYWFHTRSAQAGIASHLNTTVQATLNLKDLQRLSVPVIPLDEQNAIAEILGALDDKITANAQLVRTALALIHAHHRGTLSSADREVTFADIAHIGGGGTPHTQEAAYWGGNIPWAAPSDITALDAPYLTSTPRMITPSGLAACASPLYPAGSILMTSRATIGAFAVNQIPVTVNQGFIVAQPYESAIKWWLFAEMKRRVPEFVARANGATFLELSRGTFRGMTLRVPSTETVRAFDAVATPLHERALSAVRENSALADLRDTLLQALMDGRLRVRDAIKQAEEVL